MYNCIFFSLHFSLPDCHLDPKYSVIAENIYPKNNSDDVLQIAQLIS